MEKYNGLATIAKNIEYYARSLESDVHFPQPWDSKRIFCDMHLIGLEQNLGKIEKLLSQKTDELSPGITLFKKDVSKSDIDETQAKEDILKQLSSKIYRKSRWLHNSIPLLNGDNQKVMLRKSVTYYNVLLSRFKEFQTLYNELVTEKSNEPVKNSTFKNLATISPEIKKEIKAIKAQRK